MRQVLVADDDPDIVDLLRLVLEGEGYTVATARDGVETLDFLARTDDGCVVLLDLMMPRLTGLDVCERLLAAGPTGARHRVVLMTASDPTRQTYPPPARALLLKPFDLDALLHVVGELAGELTDGGYVREEAVRQGGELCDAN
jgi:CheY-like chemotaxis protein